MDIEQLRADYRSRAKEPDTLFLLNRGDALKFVDDALSHGFTLLGIESFRVTSAGAYQPIQDFSSDVAEVSLPPDEFAASTIRLIDSSRELGDLWFQIVLDDRCCL